MKTYELIDNFFVVTDCKRETDPMPNFRGSGKALAETLRPGETLEEFTTRANKQKLANGRVNNSEKKICKNCIEFKRGNSTNYGVCDTSGKEKTILETCKKFKKK